MANRARRICSAMVLVLATGAGVSPASAASVDSAKSRIDAEFTQMSVPVDAPFRRFSGDIVFDPANPAQARARLVIETGSFDIGERDYDEEIRKPEWFDSARYPTASFTAHGLKPLGGDRYQVTGTLTLKGKTQRLTVPVTIHDGAGATIFDGQVPISRDYFDIGGPDWKGVVDDRVLVKFHIVVPKHS